MRYPTTPDVLRLRRLVIVGIAAALLLIAFVTYAFLSYRADPSTDAPTEPRISSVEPTGIDAASEVTTLPDLRSTSEPDAFARQVADALFAWDTTALPTRADHIEQLVAVADPTGESTPGLVSDLDNYLPPQEAWVELTKYETRQWLSVGSVKSPTTWAEAAEQAGDELLPGTTALTIHGTRHRAGIWKEEQVSSEHDVAFTVFVVCGPTYPECHLLRLSILNEPLD